MKKLAMCLCLCLLLPAAALAAEIQALDKAALDKILESNRGKVIMLNFFATWCPPCRVELPELVKLRDAYPDSEFMIYGLSVDEDKSAVPAFIEMAGVNYPVYMANKDITDSYNITSVPHNTFFTKDGKIIISEPGMAETGVLKKVVNDLLEGK